MSSSHVSPRATAQSWQQSQRSYASPRTFENTWQSPRNLASPVSPTSSVRSSKSQPCNATSFLNAAASRPAVGGGDSDVPAHLARSRGASPPCFSSRSLRSAGSAGPESPKPSGLPAAVCVPTSSSPDSALEVTVDAILRRLRSVTPREERARVFKEQCLAWHPDKNSGDEKRSQTAFVRLQGKRAWFLSDDP